MLNPRHFARVLTATAIGAICLIGTACSPEDAAVFASNPAISAVQAQLASTRSTGSPSDESLARLRNCESHSVYTAISRSGRYRGAYQFSQQTWDNTAATVLPDFVGLDPIQAPAMIQDAMARTLWVQAGPGSWPVCGRRA